MVADRHHEVVNGVGVREQADLATDGSIFFLLVMEILGEFALHKTPLSSFVYVLRRATDDGVSSASPTMISCG